MINNKRKIINEILNRDVGGIIIDMIYPKCKVCKILIDFDFIRELYDNTFICDLCITEKQYNINSCCRCYQNYIVETNYKCSVCRGNCIIYCPKDLYKCYIIQE